MCSSRDLQELENALLLLELQELIVPKLFQQSGSNIEFAFPTT